MFYSFDFKAWQILFKPPVWEWKVLELEAVVLTGLTCLHVRKSCFTRSCYNHVFDGVLLAKYLMNYLTINQIQDGCRRNKKKFHHLSMIQILRHRAELLPIFLTATNGTGDVFYIPVRRGETSSHRGAALLCLPRFFPSGVGKNETCLKHFQSFKEQIICLCRV